MHVIHFKAQTVHRVKIRRLQLSCTLSWLVGYLLRVKILNYIETYSLINAWYVDACTQNANAVKMWTETVDLNSKWVISSRSFKHDFVDDMIKQSETIYCLKPSQTKNLNYHQQQRQHHYVISIAPIQQRMQTCWYLHGHQQNLLKC